MNEEFKVTDFAYQFEVWDGDELVATFADVVRDEALREAREAASQAGANVHILEVTRTLVT